jgi:dihydroneopterin aldolase
MVDYPLVTVGGLIMAPDGEILLVRSPKWSNLYSVPGGKVEWGETREEAFRREVWEETRLKLSIVYFAIVQDCIFSTEFWDKKHFVMNDFIADLHPDYHKNQVVLNDEADGYLWISPEKAMILPLHRECRLLIDWYLKYFKIPRKVLGTIGFEDHQVRCIIGVNPEEREKEQDLLIDVKVKTSFSSCIRSDKVQETINYEELANICTRLAQDRQYRLLETLAHDVLNQFFEQFDLESAWIRIKKPKAIPSAKYAIVELEKHKKKDH